MYVHHEWDVSVACHGDDFLAEGLCDDLKRLDEVMRKHFEVKVLPRIGDPSYGGEVQEGTHLHRIIRALPKGGFSWEADPKYAGQMAQSLELDDCKGVDTPASKDTGKNERDAAQVLSDAEAKKFRHLTGTALYLSLDRPTIQFTVSQIASGMQKPTKLHMMQLKRLVRYLVKHPVEQWIYEEQADCHTIHVYSDSDWGACKTTRKSMSNYAVKVGSHLLETSCGRQSVVALSSGEAEYYALTRAASAGLLVKGIYEELGRPKNLICLTDSSAAKGITNRQGVGKVKHLSLRELWLQDAVSKKLLKVQKEDTETNWADLGTKVLEGPRISQLLSMMPLKRGVIAASMLVAARAQCPNDEDDAGGWMLPFYILLIHVLGLIGLVAVVRQMFGWNRCSLQTVSVQTSDEVSHSDVMHAFFTASSGEASTEGAEESAEFLLGIGSSSTQESGVGAVRLRSAGHQTSSEGVHDGLVAVIGNGECYHRTTCGMLSYEPNRRRVRYMHRSIA